jgi:Mrp family chromosome partitioning ATPase/NifU-like protein involved in Fe-S cluster formation
MSTATDKDQNQEITINFKQPAIAHNQINHVIGVISGKGGVGKSFITGLLASSLAQQGYQVGILDADFKGSSIPWMFGLNGPAKIGQYSFVPLQSDSGVKVISTSSLFDNENEDESIIWKESLVGEVIKQLWKEVEWGTLDYLLVDMPPATSEVAVAITQLLPFSGVIIVTMPQELSTKLVNKAVSITQKLDVPILGVVENMAYYLSPETGEKQFIFGQSGGESVASVAKAPLLTQIPLDPTVAKLCDSGKIEEVVLEECSEFGNLFLSAVSTLEQKASSLQSKSPNGDIKSSPIGRENSSEEDIAVDLPSSSQTQQVKQPYSDIVMHLIRSKENMGTLDHPDAQGFFLGSCGDRMQIDLRIIADRIIESKFMTDGCGVTIACGSMITKIACSKTVDQAGQITPEELLSALGGLPPDHEHCAVLAVMTLREALIDAVEGFGKPRTKPKNN